MAKKKAPSKKSKADSPAEVRADRAKGIKAGSAADKRQDRAMRGAMAKGRGGKRGY